MSINLPANSQLHLNTFINSIEKRSGGKRHQNGFQCPKTKNYEGIMEEYKKINRNYTSR